MLERKKQVAVIYGSRSVEHEVSIITALQVMGALDKSKYEVVPIYITREGSWLTGPALFTGSANQDIQTHSKIMKGELTATPVTMPADPRIGGLISPVVAGMMTRTKVMPLDLVVPVIHGTHGEDGTLQGLLELADLPYVGSGTVASAVGMDKIMAKGVFREQGLRVVDYVAFTRHDWEEKADEITAQIETKLGYPTFVKPANLGSSIGISKVESAEELSEAIEVALSYDSRAMVERAVQGAIEINCSVIGNEEPEASVCEQPVSWEQFLTFDDKYLHNAGAGMKGAERRIPAPIPDAKTEEIRQLAVAAFKAIGCRGIARVDFLVGQTSPDQFGDVYINEVNTIPGSYSFYLWSASGVTPVQLMDRLVEYALDAHAEKRKTTYTYASGILEQASTSLSLKK
jgi:D-alanine-D-alanine ligase